MLLDSLYYFLKPALPWRVRVGLRRWRAQLKLAAYSDVWPIDEKAAAVPPNWPGWPEGKRFAMVLTHDVEGTKGVERVERLKQLELKQGFRSSFNFVPEGEYRVSDSLRRSLGKDGFEVGVHGLEHDGKLYASRAKFHAKAIGIRKYLHLWGASGFRSPLMQHNLTWLHELGAEYDSSTFDTDPFEPQSDGVGTIFPFWVPGPANTGYVELPYTLVQDFTLFVVLQKQNIDIWKRKIDWIAEHGGMALLNTHPDYMCFEGTPQRDEFPVCHYEELLNYAHEKYGNDMWVATPREVSDFYRSSLPLASRSSRKRICMLTHSQYDSDNRVRRYAEALAKRGDHVDVLSICFGDVAVGTESLNGVSVHRIQHRERNERGKWEYARRLLRFVLASASHLTRKHDSIRYDVVHVHNIPDFLVFAAWFPKWTGAKLILDIHDIVPEFFSSKFKMKMSGLYVKTLKLVEKLSAAFADHVIVANHIWYDTLVSRSVRREKCSVFLNHVDSSIFYRRLRTRTDEKIIILFPGSLGWHQGLDIAIDAFALIKDKVPNAEFHIYGRGGMEADLKRQVERLGLRERVKFFEGVSLDQMPQVIANADMGVVPKRADGFGNEAYSTKIMEFMSQAVPVICSRTKIDTFYFDDSVVRFFPSGDHRAMADAMLSVIQNRDVRDRLLAAGLEYVSRNSWEVKRADYLALVDSLSTETFEDLNVLATVRSD